MKTTTKKKRALPLWFHVVFAGAFGVLVLGFLVVRSGAIDARAQSIFDSMAGAVSPVLNAGAMLGRHDTESAEGSYVLNGMHVRYVTYGAPRGGGRTIIELEQLMARAGYVHRILPIQGAPTLVGIHPETKVMLTARPGRDLAGNPAVRLSQQNLSELREDFDAQIPGVPVYPGATGKMLISSDHGPKSESLMYAALGAVADIRSYYVAEMRAAGWTALGAPSLSGRIDAGVTFFKKGGEEASVLLTEIPETAGTLVMVTVGPAQAEVG
jgi:hypothetical protein